MTYETELMKKKYGHVKSQTIHFGGQKHVDP